MATGVANNNIAALTAQASNAMQALSGLGVNVNGGGTAAAPAAGAAPAGGTAAAAAADPKSKIPATGQPQAVMVNGVMKYYDNGIDPKTGQRRADGTAHEISAYQFAQLEKIEVNLSPKPGLSTGLMNLGKMIGATQQRVSSLSSALSIDATKNGAFDPKDLQHMSMETSMMQMTSEMAKKIFDSMQQASQVWLR